MSEATGPSRSLGTEGGLTARRPLPFLGKRLYLATADVEGARVMPSAAHTFEELPARAGLVLEPGDVLQAKMAETDKAVLVSDAMAGWLASTGFAQFSPDPAVTDPRYLFQWLRSDDFWRVKERLCVGSTQRAINQSDLAGVPVVFPDVPVQARIAEILSMADEAIEQTEALIAKTQQIKAGLMHDLFTRGVTADGQLRPPRAEAPQLYKESPLGWVPQEWQVLQVRELTSLVTSGSRGWAAFYSIEGALFVRSQNVRMGYLDFSDRQHVVPPPGSEGLRTKLGPLDLLVTITGNNVGNVACVPATWNDDAFVSQHVGLVRFHDPALAELAGNFLVPGSPGNQQLVEAQYGQSKPGLNLNNLRDLHLPIPGVTERELIVECLDATVAQLEAEISYVAELAALKRGLMADLFTGRVPVSVDSALEPKEVAANV